MRGGLSHYEVLEAEARPCKVRTTGIEGDFRMSVCGNFQGAYGVQHTVLSAFALFGLVDTASRVVRRLHFTSGS